jgi:hypothetical protein
MRLGPEQRLAGVAAAALLLTLFLPWYQKSVAVGNRILEDNESAFGVFTFVEAAIFLVALGVFGLLYARSKGKPFHLPGGDGTVIFAAGVWSGVLLLWRVFDRPDIEGRGVTVGITWGFFFAFLAAAFLAAAGWRLRAAHVPEPPNPAAAPEPEPRPAARRRPRRPPVEPGTDVTRRLPAQEPPTDVTRRLPAEEPPPADEAPTEIAPREGRRRLFDDPSLSPPSWEPGEADDAEPPGRASGEPPPPPARG